MQNNAINMCLSTNNSQYASNMHANMQIVNSENWSLKRYNNYY